MANFIFTKINKNGRYVVDIMSLVYLILFTFQSNLASQVFSEVLSIVILQTGKACKLFVRK